jgi:hypothetical protein
MIEVTGKHVPLSKPAPFWVPWWSEGNGELVEEARKAFKRHWSNQTELTSKEYAEANRAK